ncbi:MAG: carbon-nitrogen hydrolase family protein [Ruminococcaceae bacterium]|nr:carbon-nitrogen hydrolase family protein [Oscillospiraceae bacterium]
MAYKDIVNIAVVNFRPFWGRKDRNLSRIIEYIESASKRGVDIICFPELALTGYENEPDVELPDKMQVRLAETIPGPSVNAVAEATSKCGIYAVFGMTEKAEDDKNGVYNVAVVCGPDGYIGTYRKIHPANDELLWSEKGCDPLDFETPWGPVGVGICYDTYSFPELGRYYAAKGARLFINITAMVGESGIRRFDWEGCYLDTMKAAVVANDFFIASSNLIGIDVINEGFVNIVGNDTVKNPAFFAGASLIMGPGYNKKVHIYAGGIEHREIDMIISTIDLSLASRMIFNENPYSGSPDFRPDIYKKFANLLLEDDYWNKHAIKD